MGCGSVAWRATACALAATVLAARAAAAQGAGRIVAGSVIDSIANLPLAGAHLLLVPAADPAARPMVGDADDRGAFRIAGVAPGRYLLAVEHPRLDALGVELPPVPVLVGSDSVVTVSAGVPGPRTLARMLCGVRTDSSGALAGRVLDAERASAVLPATVTASWAEIRLGRGVPERVPFVRRVATDESGRFVICGLPSDVAVLVQAAAGRAASGEIELQAPADAVLVRDLYVATSATPVSAATPGDAPSRARGTASVAGRVRRSDGAPLSGAQVVVLGTGVSAVTSETGRFEIGALPGGTRTVEVRALGYLPGLAVVDLSSRRAAAVDLTLAPRSPMLDAVTVYGMAPDRRDAAGFAERSRGIFGRFITADQIARGGALDVPDVLRTVPGLRVVQAAGSMMSTVYSRGDSGFSSSCMPAVYLDGMYIAEGARSLENLVRPSDIGGIEVYVDPSTAPPQYQRGACGSVVIWTRAMVMPQ